MEPPPDVTVVCATYHRTDVLRHAIASVRASSIQGWELLVVGDACRDDTGAVVASFADPRVRFTNLARNHGEQSGPNNAGCRRARAPVIAFLNNDDLFFSDHLERALAFLDETGADLVFPGPVVAEPTATGLGFRLTTPWMPGGRFHPIDYVPASTWVFRRALFDRLGGWRAARELDIEPSQDFLLRAWRAGADLRLMPAVSVLLVPSSGTPGSYRERSAVHARLRAEMEADEGSFRARVLEQLLLSMPSPWARFKGLARHLLGHSLGSLLARRGVHPKAWLYRLRYGGRGGFLRTLRATRGQRPESVATGEAGSWERWLRTLRR